MEQWIPVMDLYFFVGPKKMEAFKYCRCHILVILHNSHNCLVAETSGFIKHLKLPIK